MWIFTPFGFFSVVAHRERDTLIVRARARTDLVRLTERTEGRIVHTPGADYPYRIELTRAALDAVLSGFVHDELTYPNFKTEVARHNVERAHLLHDVWAVMHRAEDAGSRRRRRARRLKVAIPSHRLK